MSLRFLSRLALILPCLLLCSCVETSQEKLIGRWFNSSNSIRFTAEGHVRWNSRRGVAQGNYFYDGSKRRTSSNIPIHNLSLDLIRNGQTLQPEFELEFVGNDRVRLTRLSEATGTRRPLVLTRAGDGDKETLIPLETVDSAAEEGVETYSGE